MMKEGIIDKISSLLKHETNQNVIVNSIRIVSELCKKSLARVITPHHKNFYFYVC